MKRVVIDTNVFISALIKEESNPSDILLSCLEGHHKPLMSNALTYEAEEVLYRLETQKGMYLSVAERKKLFYAYMRVCEWRKIYFLLRPNLRDEGDNHLIELALAGNADYIITGNIRDFQNAQINVYDCKIVTPREFLEERTKEWIQ